MRYHDACVCRSPRRQQLHGQLGGRQPIPCVSCQGWRQGVRGSGPHCNAMPVYVSHWVTCSRLTAAGVNQHNTLYWQSRLPSNIFRHWPVSRFHVCQPCRDNSTECHFLVLSPNCQGRRCSLGSASSGSSSWSRPGNSRYSNGGRTPSRGQRGFGGPRRDCELCELHDAAGRLCKKARPAVPRLSRAFVDACGASDSYASYCAA